MRDILLIDQNNAAWSGRFHQIKHVLVHAGGEGS